MKIYPSSHVIQAKEKTTPVDIPLAYIQAEEKSIDVDIEYTPRFIQPKTQQSVNIYQSFTDPDTFFFDSDEKYINNVPLKRVGEEYMYSPNVTEFSPEQFTYQAILQRRGIFSPTVPYNIKIGVVEDSILGVDFSSKLISIFSDAARRGLCPENVTVNNGSLEPNSLINSSYLQDDFLFIGSEVGTGKVPIKTGTDTETSMQTILDANCNIWMAVESFDPLLESVETTDLPCALQKSVLYNQDSYTIPDYAYQFNLTKVHDAYPVTDFEYINLFVGTCPVLVLKKKNAGFLIVSEKDFLESLTENISLIYEILIQIYLQSYVHTKTRTSWITDNPVMYYLNKQNKYNQNHPVINLANLLKKDDIDTSQEFILATIITSDNAAYAGIDSKSNLYFKKLSTPVDLTDSEDQITILSASGTVLLCDDLDDTVTIIEDQLQLSYVRSTIGYTLTIQPFKSSSLKLNTELQTLTIPDTDNTYILYIKPLTSGDVAAVWQLTLSSAFVSSMGVQAARIKIKKELILTTFDLRQRGGGEASSITNYEMIDEGNILGRPYRRGTALIVKVPKRYTSYEAKIKEQLQLNIASGEEPILVFV